MVLNALLSSSEFLLVIFCGVFAVIVFAPNNIYTVFVVVRITWRKEVIQSDTKSWRQARPLPFHTLTDRAPFMTQHEECRPFFIFWRLSYRRGWD